MELTRGEFCQFNLTTRSALLREFGKNIIQKKINRKMVTIYWVFGFYVEVYENLASKQVEKIEPVRHDNFLDFYASL